MDTARARDRERLLPLWFGMLGPPLAWGARIGASYFLVPFACSRDALLLLHGLTLAALLVTAWAGVVAWGRWRATGRSEQVELGGAEARARFMALTGILGSGLFFAVIVAEGLANVFIDPCQTGGVLL